MFSIKNLKFWCATRTQDVPIIMGTENKHNICPKRRAKKWPTFYPKIIAVFCFKIGAYWGCTLAGTIFFYPPPQTKKSYPGAGICGRAHL